MTMLNLKSSSPEERRGRNWASYRVMRQESRDTKDPVIRMVRKDECLQINASDLKENLTDWSILSQTRRRSGNINTILEEEDTSDGL